VRPPALNTAKRIVVALLPVAALALGLAACGGSAPNAATLVRDTFQAQKPIESGRLNLSFSISGKGSAAFAKPLTMHLSGPFQSTGAKQLPQFDLQLGLAAAGTTLHAGAISAGDRFFIQLEGTSFVAPKATTEALRKSYAKARSGETKAGSRSTFSALGIEPGGWLSNPVNEGEVKIGGEETIHLRAALDSKRFLTEVQKLSGAAGSLGAGQVSGALSPKLISALAKSISSARIDVYTGSSDHLLRRLHLVALLKPTPEARAALSGLRSATLTLDLSFSEVNRPQTISAPSNPKPISQLISSLAELGLVERAAGTTRGTGAEAGESGAEGEASAEGEAGAEAGGSGSEEGATEEGATEAAAGASGQAYLECVRKAGKSVAALQECVALLHG